MITLEQYEQIRRMHYLEEKSGREIARLLGISRQTVAKALQSFAKANQHLLIKAGYVEGQVLPAEQLRVLADLPSRDALRGQLVSTLQAPMAQLIGLLNAARRELVYVLEQRGADAAKPQGES